LYPQKENFVKRLFLIVLAMASSVLAAAKYPFPYNADYAYGIRPPLKSTTNDDIQAVYEDWLTNYYSDCSDGSARVKWTDPAASAAGCSADGGCTVSEGIGYGMMILVYMDNGANNTQAKFDKLLKYYKKFPDSKGLMKWLIDGCNSAKKDGGATDSEMDVIFALIMANKQWGNASYLTDAQDLLGKVWNSEVDQGAKLLKPGSLWTQSVFNPSYFATGALRIFQKIDAAHDWKGVADNSLALIKKNQNSSTGLVSDWCNSGGASQDVNGSGTGKFGYDAARTPWRVTLDYLWYGTAAAKEINAPITKWARSMTTNNPGRIRADYKQDGTTSVTTWTNALYTGALTTPGMSDTGMTWITQGMRYLFQADGQNYYNSSWKLLYELTMSGNFQNFAETVKPMNTGVIGADGRSVPQGWSVRRSGRGIRVELPEAGSAELLDAKGVMVSSAAGSKSLDLVKPSEAGVYYAVVRCAGRQSVLPVMGD